jgi:predicted peroxiredoxin
MAKLLYIGTHGTDDPTNATFPFLMAKGAIEGGMRRVLFSWEKLRP